MSLTGNAGNPNLKVLRGRISKISPNAIDDTLTVDGAAADAKATGDAIAKAKSDVVKQVETTIKDNVPKNAVLYTEQALTEAQKAQARFNIGAISEDEIPEGSGGSASGSITMSHAFKKVLVMGDSISADYYGSYIKWVTYLKREGFFPANGTTNDSIHATGFVATYAGNDDFLTRIEAVKDKSSYDLVVVFGGINDYIQGIPMGETGGDKTTYFKPAVDYFFEYLVNNFTQARICVLSPLRTYNIWNNKAGHHQTEYMDYIKEVAKSYCLPVLNLSEESGFCPFIDAFKNKWTLVPSGYTDADGVHPTTEYQEYFLAPMIKGFISSFAKWDIGYGESGGGSGDSGDSNTYTLTEDDIIRGAVWSGSNYDEPVTVDSDRACSVKFKTTVVPQITYDANVTDIGTVLFWKNGAFVTEVAYSTLKETWAVDAAFDEISFNFTWGGATEAEIMNVVLTGLSTESGGDSGGEGGSGDTGDSSTKTLTESDLTRGSKWSASSYAAPIETNADHAASCMIKTTTVPQITFDRDYTSIGEVLFWKDGVFVTETTYADLSKTWTIDAVFDEICFNLTWGGSSSSAANMNIVLTGLSPEEDDGGGGSSGDGGDSGETTKGYTLTESDYNRNAWWSGTSGLVTMPETDDKACSVKFNTTVVPQITFNENATNIGTVLFWKDGTYVGEAQYSTLKETWTVDFEFDEMAFNLTWGCADTAANLNVVLTGLTPEVDDGSGDDSGGDTTTGYTLVESDYNRSKIWSGTSGLTDVDADRACSVKFDSTVVPQITYDVNWTTVGAVLFWKNGEFVGEVNHSTLKETWTVDFEFDQFAFNLTWGGTYDASALNIVLTYPE